MIELKTSLQGEQKAHALLNKLSNAPDLISRELSEWSGELVGDELYGMGNYAPPPANSTYIRTGRLGASWGLRMVSKLAVEFVNLASYAGYVIGNALGQQQASIHAGRWWLARKKIEAAVPKLVERLERRFNGLK